MSLHDEVLKQIKVPFPKSTTEKYEVANLIVEGIKETQLKYELHKWVMSGRVYQMKKYNLYHYVNGKVHSKAAFYDEHGIPQSTARYYEMLWDFYVEQHDMKIDELIMSDTHKLQRAIPYIKEQNTKAVKDVVELAQKGRMSRDEFIDELKQLYGVQQ